MIELVYMHVLGRDVFNNCILRNFFLFKAVDSDKPEIPILISRVLIFWQYDAVILVLIANNFSLMFMKRLLLTDNKRIGFLNTSRL